MPKPKPLPFGKKFSALTLIGDRGCRGKKRTRWVLVRCDCGTEKEVRYQNIKHYGSPRDCGCGAGSGRHYLVDHTLYGVWSQMKSRCYNCNHKSYKDYGGRGIKVCNQWRSDFKLFYRWAKRNGYKNGLQIDRIDFNGNYSPRNCRFVTQAENLRNRRSCIAGKAKITAVPDHKEHEVVKQYSRQSN